MILVFGATGKSGAPVADELAKRGAAFKVFVRRPEAAAQFEARGIPAVIGDIHDPASLAAAFEDIDKALYLSPGSVRLAEEFEPVLAAAKGAGVQHLVRLSVLGAGLESNFLLGRAHGEADEALKQSGISYTLLKPTFFMQNFLDMAPSIAGQGAIYASAGEGRLAFVDTRDIGAVAAAVLSAVEDDGGSYRGKEYDLTGPEALTHSEAAAKFSAALGKPVQYIDVPLPAAREAMIKRGLPAEMADALVDLMQNVAQTSQGAEIKGDVEAVSGQPPRSLDTFIADHLSAFQGGEAGIAG